MNAAVKEGVEIQGESPHLLAGMRSIEEQLGVMCRRVRLRGSLSFMPLSCEVGGGGGTPTVGDVRVSRRRFTCGDLEDYFVRGIEEN